MTYVLLFQIIFLRDIDRTLIVCQQWIKMFYLFQFLWCSEDNVN